MIREISAGGVVIFGNAFLLLKKFNGDWVLPKGRVEEGENYEQAALREVYEESGVRASIDRYIGESKYRYKNYQEDKIVDKTVHWYLMKSKNMNVVPQKNEGFIEAKFIHMDRAEEYAKYEDEKEIINKLLKMLD